MYLFLLLQRLTNDTQRLQNFWLERNALILMHAFINVNQMPPLDEISGDQCCCLKRK